MASGVHNNLTHLPPFRHHIHLYCLKNLLRFIQPAQRMRKVGGISTAELNVLEREFLRMIEWRLTVSLCP